MSEQLKHLEKEICHLHAENERLSATVKAREDEILTHSEAFYEATRLLSEEREKNERLHAENELLASAADKLRIAWRDEVQILIKEKDELIIQRDVLLEACKVALGIIGFGAEHDQISVAIKLVEGEKT